MAHDILPGVRSELPLGELQERFAGCDIAAVDLDECMIPGFAQVVLARRILLRAGLRPHRLRDWLRIPSLAKGGLAVTAFRTLDFIGFQVSRPKMMFFFERAMRRLPRAYFDHAVRGIGAMAYPNVREALALLSRRMPVGIVSFCLDTIVREFVREFNASGEEIVSFYESNRLSFVPEDGRDVLQGYDRSRFMTRPEDKRVALEERMQACGARRPLIIGQSDEDVGMARLAAERGGISIGFNPLRSCVGEFDVAAWGKSWQPVEELCQQLSGADEKS